MTTKRRSLSPTALAAAAGLWLAASPFARGTGDILRDGSARLVQLQADITADNAGNGSPDSDPDDGGWDFIVQVTDVAHTSAASPLNTYGITALGPALAFRRGSADIGAFVACLDAYGDMAGNPMIRSGPDPTFLYLMNRITGDATFADEARAKRNGAAPDAATPGSRGRA